MAKKKPTREQIYDDQISPLMAQIIEICKAKKIPMIADFDLGDGLKCTTYITDEKWKPDESLAAAYDCLKPRKSRVLMMTVRDGEDKITAMHAFCD